MWQSNSRLKKVLAIGGPILFLLVLIGLLAWWEGAFSAWGAFLTVLETSLITLVGEYPDQPESPGGRVAQLLLLLSGTLVLGTIVGKISSLFVTSALHKEKKMPKFSNHIIICNWNSKAPSIIQQLLDATDSMHKDIVVVTATDVPEKEAFDDCDNVTFIQSDPSHHSVLASLNASKAQAIILLADPESAGPDEKNALIALAVKHLEEEPDENLNIHVVAELINPEHRRHLREAGVDEVVLFQDYSSGILAQSALFHNMSVVYQRLLTYSDDTNEIYFIGPGNYPADFIGRNFPELCQSIAQTNADNGDNPVLLMGVKLADGEILLNPQKHRFHALGTGDSLIIMAFKPVDHIAATQ